MSDKMLYEFGQEFSGLTGESFPLLRGPLFSSLPNGRDGQFSFQFTYRLSNKVCYHQDEVLHGEEGIRDASKPPRHVNCSRNIGGILWVFLHLKRVPTTNSSSSREL